MTPSTDTSRSDPSADFGAYLRDARERRGVSLREIARVTKIGAMALEALERNEISRLPGGIFSRAFVRSYAAQVGLDPEDTVRRFIERFPNESVVAGSPYVRDTRAEEAFEVRRRTTGLVLGLSVISVPIIGGILYLGVAGRSSDSQADAASRTVAAVEASPVARTESSAGSMGDEASEPLVLILEATGLCWVSTMVDGERVFERVMTEGERERLEAHDEILLSVGAPEALSFTINGRPGRVLGRPGQVVSARIDHGNYHEFIDP